MTLLEKKVDTISQILVESDFTHRNALLAELKEMMKQSESAGSSAEAIILDLLLELGVPENILGHGYLVTAIQIALDQKDAVYNITGYLYPAVGKEWSTTGSRAERAIRHAIELSWDRCDLDVIAKYFGNTVCPVKGKPTNGEFISRLASVVRGRMV